jgi:hypothetical protein
MNSGVRYVLETNVGDGFNATLSNLSSGATDLLFKQVGQQVSRDYNPDPLKITELLAASNTPVSLMASFSIE